MWDYLRKDYVDPRTSPNVVEFQIDPLTGFKYYSIDTLSKSEKAAPFAKASKKTPLTPPTDEVIFHDFDLPHDYSRTGRRGRGRCMQLFLPPLYNKLATRFVVSKDQRP
jgi:hypothetical protein